MSLTEGDDIKLLGFNNLQEVVKTSLNNSEARLRTKGMRQSSNRL